jgi:hypothetical protein
MAGFSLVQAVQLMMLSANCTLLYTCVLKIINCTFLTNDKPAMCNEEFMQEIEKGILV